MFRHASQMASVATAKRTKMAGTAKRSACARPDRASNDFVARSRRECIACWRVGCLVRLSGSIDLMNRLVIVLPTMSGRCLRPNG